MKILNNTLKLLTKKYPHSVNMLTAFTPLFAARLRLAACLPATPSAPALSAPFFAPDRGNIKFYLDEHFLREAPRELCEAAMDGFPAKMDELRKLKELIQANCEAASALAALTLLGKPHRVPYWAKKHAQDRDAARLLSSHLAGTAARRLAEAVEVIVESKLVEQDARVRGDNATARWKKGWCPICGHAPQAGFLREEEGHRSLLCALCGHEWHFSPTVCPFCEDDTPEKRQVYFIEKDPWFRAEACEICRRYLPVPDLRAGIGDMPGELILLCLTPLDTLMRDKGYMGGS